MCPIHLQLHSFTIPSALGPLAAMPNSALYYLKPFLPPSPQIKSAVWQVCLWCMRANKTSAQGASHFSLVLGITVEVVHDHKT